MEQNTGNAYTYDFDCKFWWPYLNVFGYPALCVHTKLIVFQKRSGTTQCYHTTYIYLQSSKQFGVSLIQVFTCSLHGKALRSWMYLYVKLCLPTCQLYCTFMNSQFMVWLSNVVLRECWHIKVAHSIRQMYSQTLTTSFSIPSFHRYFNWYSDLDGLFLHTFSRICHIQMLPFL